MVDRTHGSYISELPLKAQINLRGRPGDEVFQGKIEAFLEASLPSQCGQVQHYMVILETKPVAFKALWLAPDEWLIVAGLCSRAALLQVFGKVLEGCHHAATDVSANRNIILLEGKNALAILGQGCSLDLDGEAFPSATAVQTRIARTQAILERVSDVPAFHLYVRNSFGEYLMNWLRVASAEAV